MTPASVRRLLTAVLAAAVLVLSGPASAQENAEALFQEGRRLFDSLDYDKAVVALDQAIAAFTAVPDPDPARRERLASAYEMRARSKFGLGDQDGAKGDFLLLLKLSPGYALSGQVSPRVVALFEETAAQAVTNLTISLTPATAKLAIDGVPIAGPGTIRVAVGDHVITAEQPGYRAVRQTFTATAGTPAEVSLLLERTSSVIRIVTTPADVEVKVDGVLAGKTVPAADAPAGSTTAPSAPLIVNDVATGTRTIEMSRECFVTATQRVEVAQPDDYTVGPVSLRPAFGTLAITANQPGAQVFVDGKERGTVPLKLTDLCAGPHLVELRTRFGADSRRIEVKAGAELGIESVLKPVYAIVSQSGGQAAAGQDLRMIVERALAGSRTVSLVAPAPDLADKSLKDNQLAADWLAMDVAGRPVGTSAQIAGPLRKEASARLSETFRSQGVASVTVADGSRVVISLLTAGSGIPDVFEVALDSPQSISAAVDRLDRSFELLRSSAGIQAIDVADVPGAVIVGIDGKGPAAASAARPGDIIVAIDGKPVTDTGALLAVIHGKRAGEVVAMDVRDVAGTQKRVEVKLASTPRTIGLFEQGVLANRILVDLRSRLADATDPFESSVLRLNIGVALARLGDWSAAADEWQRVKLPETSAVGEGTVQYLLGLAAENLGRRADAEAAFKAAASSDSLLSEDGPAVRDLAEAKLAELSKPAR
jgi:hypothetical protein